VCDRLRRRRHALANARRKSPPNRYTRRWPLLPAHDGQHPQSYLPLLRRRLLLGQPRPKEEDVCVEGVSTIADVVHREREVGATVACSDWEDFYGGGFPQRGAGGAGHRV